MACSILAPPASATDGCDRREIVASTLAMLHHEPMLRGAVLPTGEIITQNADGKSFLIRPQPTTLVNLVWDIKKKRVDRFEFQMIAANSLLRSDRVTARFSDRVRFDKLIDELLDGFPPKSAPDWIPSGEIQLRSKAFYKRFRTSEVVLKIERKDGNLVALTVHGVDQSYPKRYAPGRTILDERGKEISTPKDAHIATIHQLQTGEIAPLPLATGLVLRERILRAELRRRLPHRMAYHGLVSVFYPYKPALDMTYRFGRYLVTGVPMTSGRWMTAPLRVLKRDGAHLTVYMILLSTGLHPTILAYQEYLAREEGQRIDFDAWDSIAQTEEPLRDGPTVLINGLPEKDFLRPAVAALLLEAPASREGLYMLTTSGFSRAVLQDHVAAHGLVNNLTIVGHGFDTQDPATGAWVRGVEIDGIGYVESADLAERLEQAHPGALYAPVESIQIAEFLAPNARVEFISCQMGRSQSGKTFAAALARQLVAPRGGALVTSTFSIAPNRRSYTPEMAKQMVVEEERIQKAQKAQEANRSAVSDFFQAHFVVLNPATLGDIIREILELESVDPNPVEVFRFPVR